MPTWTKEVVDLSVAGSSLTIDNIKIDGTYIGHTDDDDLLRLSPNLFQVSGSLVATGNGTIGGALDVQGASINLGANSYMTLTENEIDISSGDLTVDVAGDIYFDAGGADIKFGVGGTNWMTWTPALGLTLHSAIDPTNDNVSLRPLSNGVLSIVTTNNSGAQANIQFDPKAGSNVQCNASLIVGVDDTGYDVKFFGATSGSYMLWDESDNELEVYNGTITCTSTNESDTTDPRIDLYNDESSPGDDSLGTVRWHGNNAADEKTMFAKINVLSPIVTDSQEGGEMRLNIMTHGVQNTIWLKGEAQTSTDTIKTTFPQNGGVEIGTNSTNRGILKLWDGGGGNTPGYLILYSPNGTANYIFCEDDGTLKRHTSAPAANADGDAIGGQTD